MSIYLTGGSSKHILTTIKLLVDEFISELAIDKFKST